MTTETFSLLDDVPSNCIVLHVKLTDSSLKCLENYRIEHFKKKLPEQMKIKLEPNQGVISVPNAEGNARSFSFNLSSLPQNDASTDCFLQSDKKKCFQNIGTINQKIVVRASEDVYQNTMEKISNTNLEIKKNCTKEIKLKVHPKNSNSIHAKLMKLKESRSGHPLDKKHHDASFHSADRKPIPRPPHKIIKAPVKEEPVKVEKIAPKKPVMPEVMPPAEDPAEAAIQPVKQEEVQEETSRAPIQSNDEYLAAKEEFEQKYKVLSLLNTRIENRLKYFNSLVKKFKQTMQKELLEPIYNEHAFLSNNDDHTREKEEFNSLHSQLTALKKIIHSYKPPAE